MSSEVQTEIIHEHCEILAREGFLEKGFTLSNSNQTLFVIREVTYNRRAGKRTLQIDYCPVCGESLE